MAHRTIHPPSLPLTAFRSCWCWRRCDAGGGGLRDIWCAAAKACLQPHSWHAGWHTMSVGERVVCVLDVPAAATTTTSRGWSLAHDLAVKTACRDLELETAGGLRLASTQHLKRVVGLLTCCRNKYTSAVVGVIGCR